MKAINVLLLLLLLTSCIGTPSIQTVEVTRIIPQTVVVTKLIEKIITATPLAPTLTPTVTSTPEMTSTPTFMIWNTQQVVDAFKIAGLEAENARPMTVDDYGMAPMLALEATRFIIPSLCADCGGRIMSFNKNEDLEVVKNYYDELAKSSALFFSWVFVKDNILVQINGDLPEPIAKQYETALFDMSE